MTLLGLAAFVLGFLAGKEGGCIGKTYSLEGFFPPQKWPF